MENTWTMAELKASLAAFEHDLRAAGKSEKTGPSAKRASSVKARSMSTVTIRCLADH